MALKNYKKKITEYNYLKTVLSNLEILLNIKLNKVMMLNQIGDKIRSIVG